MCLLHSEGITQVPGEEEKGTVQDCTHAEQLDSWDGKRCIRSSSLDLCFHLIWVYTDKKGSSCVLSSSPSQVAHMALSPSTGVLPLFFWILTKCGCLLVGEELAFATGHTWRAWSGRDPPTLSSWTHFILHHCSPAHPASESVLVNFGELDTHNGVTWEKGASVKELSPSDWTVAKSLGAFSDYRLMKAESMHYGQCLT